MLRKILICVSVIVFLAGLMACGGGSPAKKIIGKWQGDIELFKQSPEYKEMENNPMGGFTKMFIEMIGNMKMEITGDTIIMEMEVEMMGEKKSETSKYKVVSETKDSVTIENTEGKDKGEKKVIKIIDSKHIQLNEVGQEDKPGLTFKKI